MRIPRVLAVAAAILALGCGRGQPPGGESRADTARPAESMPAGQQPRMELGAAAQLDSGNVAYRARDYRAALAHYRKATERTPGLAAGWFGIYMAQNALGDKAGADSAMRMVQSIAPGTMGGHPAGTSGGSLPAGHPAVGSATSAPAPPADRSPGGH